MAARRVLGREPEDRGRERVERVDAPVRVDDDDALAHGIEDRADTRLGLLAQGALELPDLGGDLRG